MFVVIKTPFKLSVIKRFCRPIIESAGHYFLDASQCHYLFSPVIIYADVSPAILMLDKYAPLSIFTLFSTRVCFRQICGSQIELQTTKKALQMLNQSF